MLTTRVTFGWWEGVEMAVQAPTCAWLRLADATVPHGTLRNELKIEGERL